jgi:hypothetical protein
MTDIEGMVTDEVSGQPIEGIRISSGYSNGAISDKEGKFNIKHFEHPPTTITITVEDTDGPENGGEYVTQTVERELVQENFAPAPKYDGPGANREGHLEVDITLALKPQENETE